MTTPEGTSAFTLDATDQLLSASLTGESYAYDSTGNRTSGGTQTGSGNRLAFDGTYRYAYDAEGNRTAKFLDTNAGGTLSAGDTDVTAYGYDQRNRLVAVSHVNTWTTAQATALGSFVTTGLPASDLELRYTYDYADRRIRRMIDADGIAGAGQESVSFAGYAGDVRTLEIARPNDKLVIDSATGKVFGFLGQVVQRNLYGNGVDDILAVDQITWNGSTPTTSTFWTLGDHQDSVRDIVSGNAVNRGQVVEHRQYDSFGKIVKRVAGAQAGAPVTAGVGIDFGYAGRPLEARSGLSDNRARWYEPGTGRFINEDPSGFKGGDANLFRYVGNDPLNQVDPSGLCAAQVFQSPTISPLGWSVLGQQAPLLTPTTVSQSVAARAYSSLVRQPTQAAPAPIFSSMPAMTPTVSGGSAYMPGTVSRTNLAQATPTSPFQSVYRTEVERITVPPASAVSVNSAWNGYVTGYNANTRDARAWTDAAGNRWNTDVSEISAYGPPPPPPTWGQFAEAVSGIAVALAGSGRAAAVGRNAPPRTVQDLQRGPASQANAPFIARGWNAPYAQGTQTRVFTAGSDMDFLRVHGIDNQQGAFLVRAKEIAGMDRMQVQKHLALPYTPTFVSDVYVPAGSRIQMGKVDPQPAFGAPDPSGIQYQLLNQIPSSSFINMRPLP